MTIDYHYTYYCWVLSSELLISITYVWCKTVSSQDVFLLIKETSISNVIDAFIELSLFIVLWGKHIYMYLSA